MAMAYGALEFVRETMTAVIGDLEPQAQEDVRVAALSVPMLGELDEEERDEILTLSTRLLTDVWLMGQFAGAVDP